MPDRLQDVTDDSSLYLDNTGIEIHNLLVTNFEELEKVLNQTLDEGGPILKRKLAHITNAVAIDNITDIVSRLGNVRSHLKEINKITNVLQVNVKQLKQGLEDRRTKLKRALRLCNSNKACQNFLKEYTIDKDLAVQSYIDYKGRFPGSRGRLAFHLPFVTLTLGPSHPIRPFQHDRTSQFSASLPFQCILVYRQVSLLITSNMFELDSDF